jgi:hypothetical protein
MKGPKSEFFLNVFSFLLFFFFFSSFSFFLSDDDSCLAGLTGKLTARLRFAQAEASAGWESRPRRG